VKGFRAVLSGVVSPVGWLRDYRSEDLPKDLLAGLVVAVLLVPQGMAYALLAGLPPVHGLYASVVPAVVYALLGTSRHMPVGPPALMALLTFAGVSALAEPGSARYVSLALLLAFMAGAVQLALGLLRAGFVADFLSRPVLSGFVYASAAIIVLGQLGHLLGIDGSGGGHSTLGAARALAQNAASADPLALATGLSSLAALFLLPKVLPRLPAPLLVAAGATAAAWLLGFEARGVEVVGEVPRGLPPLTFPPFDFEAAEALLPAALAVALVGYVESISVAKAVANREGYGIRPNRELGALGLANLSAAFSSGFPVAGSFSRTAVQHASGARTQLASVVGALAVVLTLLFLTPLFYHLPYPALAAIVLYAVYRLVDPREALNAFRVSAADGAALAATFAVTLLVGVGEGILAGAALSLLAFLRRTAYPELVELGYVEDKEAFLGMRSHPEAKRVPGALVLRFDGPLYYANASFLEDSIEEEARGRREGLRLVVLDCRGSDTVDLTAAEALKEVAGRLRDGGVGFALAHAKRPARERLARAGAEGAGISLHATVREALTSEGIPYGQGASPEEGRAARRGPAPAGSAGAPAVATERAEGKEETA